jgi:hypothetical protein
LACWEASNAFDQATGLDLPAILQACQHAMSGLRINISLHQMRAMTDNCLGPMGHMGMGR